MSDRLYSQVVDIFIYDLNNKYQSLKIKGIDKNKVNDFMYDYEKNRIKDFINDITRIKDISNYKK